MVHWPTRLFLVFRVSYPGNWEAEHSNMLAYSLSFHPSVPFLLADGTRQADETSLRWNQATVPTNNKPPSILKVAITIKMTALNCPSQHKLWVHWKLRCLLQCSRQRHFEAPTCINFMSVCFSHLERGFVARKVSSDLLRWKSRLKTA